jgi:HNH endonuclease/NUMOD4 motif-containing protein
MDVKENEFVDIPDFPGYRINRTGMIKSFKRYPEGKLLSPYTDKDGYICASLRRDNKSKAIKVHRAVALTFIPNPENFPQVNHKNCNKEDNEVSNLEWVSNQVNQRHAWMNDRKTVRFTVQQVREVKEYLRKGKDNTSIARLYGADPSLVSNIKTGKIWKDVE